MTPREQQVLDLLDEGLTQREIARRLDLSIGCVSKYVCTARGSDHISNASIRASSAALVAAIRQHHPEQLLMRPGTRS